MRSEQQEHIGMVAASTIWTYKRHNETEPRHDSAHHRVNVGRHRIGIPDNIHGDGFVWGLMFIYIISRIGWDFKGYLAASTFVCGYGVSHGSGDSAAIFHVCSFKRMNDVGLDMLFPIATAFFYSYPYVFYNSSGETR